MTVKPSPLSPEDSWNTDHIVQHVRDMLLLGKTLQLECDTGRPQKSRRQTTRLLL